MLYHVFCITRHHSHTVGFHDASLLVKVISFQRHPDGRRTSKVTWSILNTDRIIRMSDVDYYLVHKPFPSDFVWSLGESQLKKRKRHSTTVCCQFRKKGQFSFEPPQSKKVLLLMQTSNLQWSICSKCLSKTLCIQMYILLFVWLFNDVQGI